MPAGNIEISRVHALNLHKFIRLVLGQDIQDYVIAKRWHMDPKNFWMFKHGKSPVPSFLKLQQLAPILGVNKHLLFEVALGTPAQKVFELIKKKDRQGQIKLLGFH
jgi:hypothetical protein